MTPQIVFFAAAGFVALFGLGLAALGLWGEYRDENRAYYAERKRIRQRYKLQRYRQRHTA